MAIEATIPSTDNSVSNRKVNRGPRTIELTALFIAKLNMNRQSVHAFGCFHYCFGNGRVRVHRPA